MHIENKIIAVAGASGMVGRSIVEQLIQHSSTSVVRASYFSQSDPFSNLDKVQSVKVDLRYRELCREFVDDCDVLIVAAAVTGGAAAANAEPWKQVNDNLIIGANMLGAAGLLECGHTIFISSATAYQEFEGYITEDELDWSKNPPDSYFGVGWCWRSLEKLAEFWHKAKKIDISCIRAANIFGPFAKFNPQHSNFIPALIRKATDRMDPFEVWGAPEVTRDVIYAEDFANAIIVLTNMQLSGFNVFNLGSGKAVTVGEVVSYILKSTEHDAEVCFTKTGSVTAPHRVLDCSKLFSTINWSPVIGIEEGISRTAQWWKTNKNRWIK